MVTSPTRGPMMRPTRIYVRLLLPVLLGAWTTQRPANAPTERIVANDNRQSAGALRGDTLTLDLELRRGAWYPDTDDGPSMEIEAFGERGRPLAVPSPLIRVREGTILRVTLRNTLDSTLVVHGLHTRPGGGNDTVQVAPRAVRELRFAAGAPGTYYYWGTTAGHRTVEDRRDDDSQLGGGFIVDPRGGSAPDRVFLIGSWFRPGDSSATPARFDQNIMVINGRAWPNTERFDLTLGDSVTWRWINPTLDSHPMHLHGFYYSVESRGDLQQDTTYAPAMRPLVVTDLMLPGGTMRMRWAPTRPGNWVFHCHFAFHVSPYASLASAAAAGAERADTVHARDHVHSMSGLVLGIRVAPRHTASMAAAAPARARRIRLLVQNRARHFGDSTGYGFVVQSGAAEPRRDSIEIPGPTLVLERGRPVQITVVNHLADATGVHWHGIELESDADGVPGWSGMGARVMPPIAPGDSFVASFTPPRAGTFMYHAHANETVQTAGGLYAPLIVVEPGQRMDPSDRIVLVSLNGLGGSTGGGLVNGTAAPAPIELDAGRRHRLRLINIDADHRILFTLARDTVLLRWRALAKDGAELPRAQATIRTARLLTGPGETADFEVQLARGDSTTLVVAAPYGDPPYTIRVPVRAH